MIKVVCKIRYELIRMIVNYFENELGGSLSKNEEKKIIFVMALTSCLSIQHNYSLYKQMRKTRE